MIAIATITNLVTEIGDCDEVHITLNAVITELIQLKSAVKNLKIPEPQTNHALKNSEEEETEPEYCKCYWCSFIRQLQCESGNYDVPY